MSGSVKIGLVAIVCFVAGILVGVGIPSSAVPKEVGVEGRGGRAIDANQEISSIEQAPVSDSSLVETSWNEVSQYARKVSRLDSLKEAGTYLSILPFVGDRINATFILMFDLTKDEVSQLEGALAVSTREYREMQSQAATGGLSADGQKLIVKVPPTPEVGGAIYNRLLNSFTTVLGSDRLVLFNAISRDTFDRSYDSFGLNTVTYEVDLTPAEGSTEQRKIYNLVHSYVAPNGVNKGYGTSRTGLQELKAKFPMVLKFLPPEFKQ